MQNNFIKCIDNLLSMWYNGFTVNLTEQNCTVNTKWEVNMQDNEKKVAEKACEVYAKLGAKAREAFVNQLEGMAFVLNSQKREEVKEEKEQEAS